MNEFINSKGHFVCMTDSKNEPEANFFKVKNILMQQPVDVIKTEDDLRRAKYAGKKVIALDLKQYICLRKIFTQNQR